MENTEKLVLLEVAGSFWTRVYSGEQHNDIEQETKSIKREERKMLWETEFSTEKHPCIKQESQLLLLQKMLSVIQKYKSVHICIWCRQWI